MDNYKKKYYDALERTRAWKEKSGMPADKQSILDDIFPELKESEDENIRKTIIRFFKDNYPNETEMYDGSVTVGKAIAWLEKQGEHANFLSKIQVGDKVTRNEAGVLVNLSQLRRVAKPRKKQCKQKPVISNDALREGIAHFGITQYQIDNWLKRYVNVEKQGEQKSTELTKGEDYGIDGLWHAQRILEKTFGKVDGYQTDDGILSHECAISAVKELYEQKPAWSEEDERIILAISQLLKDCESENGWNCVYSNDREVFFADIENYLQSFKNRIAPQSKQEWSKEDEKMFDYALDMIEWYSGKNGDKSRLVSDWLKSLKDRVQPKQEWTEEDEEMFKSLKTLLNNASCYSCTKGVDKILSWLQSLRPQSKQEWNEEDDWIKTKIIKVLLGCETFLTSEETNECIDWIKSIKQRLKGKS